MTHADIIEKNVTNIEEVKNETGNNVTEIPEIITQNPALILLQEPSTSGDNNNDTAINNNIDKIKEEHTEQIKNNEITNNDTVLKYVYKKDEKIDEDKKSKGHFKNSLKRRKRSPADLLSPLPSKFQKPALIVDYETSHDPSASANWSPPLKSANIINDHGKSNIKSRRGRKYKSLRKDSIENLDEGSNESNDNEQYNQNSNDDSRESDESEERRDYNRKQNHSTRDQNRAESSERDSKNDSPYLRNDRSEKYSNKNSNTRSSNSRESNESREKQNYASIEKPHIDSHENRRNTKYDHGTKHYRPRVTDDSIEQSKENNHESRVEYPSSNEGSNENNSKYTHSKAPKQDKENQHQHTYASTRSSDEDSNENSHAPQRKDDRNHSEELYQNKNYESSNENNNDSKEKKTQVSHNNAYQHSDIENPRLNSNRLPIQDIDLDHFSHERIKLNKNGKVESLNDNRDNSDPNSAVEIISSNDAKPNTQNHDVLQLVTSIHTPLKEYANKLVQINDGEVRPVVEIHTEQDDNSNEENNKGELNNSESLESILNGKEPQSEDHQSGKIVANKEVNTGDVKQQFERIPLNYNHAQKTEKTETSKDSPKDDISKVENSPKKEIHTKNSDGTLEAFAPKDENVNIKFDDLHIQLPEINLPKDILAFTKAHSPFHDENNYDEDKKSQYPYDHSQNYKSREQNKKKQEDDDDDDDGDNKDNEDYPAYYGYYGGESEKNQDYKKKNDEDVDDEDEDLYEKFVRERFGKRGTFEKRSEKLEERPLNPHLTKTIQNILKKTADIDEQAKKSGDPNAGYMWTLEYGENL